MREFAFTGRNRLTDTLDQPCGERASRCHADLLTEHSTDRALEWVPRAGNTQSRVIADQGCEHRIVLECRNDSSWISCQVEHAPGR